jgi:hypothetical protein
VKVLVGVAAGAFSFGLIQPYSLDLALLAEWETRELCVPMYLLQMGRKTGPHFGKCFRKGGAAVVGHQTGGLVGIATEGIVGLIGNFSTHDS